MTQEKSFPALIKSTFSLSRNSDRKVLIIMFIIVAALIVDTMINQVADFISDKLVSSFGVALFVAIAAIFGIGQYFILECVKQTSKEIRSKVFYLNMIHWIVTIAQYSLMAILIFVIMQMLLMAHYSTVMLAAATTITFTVGIALIALFTQRFLLWYKLNRSSVAVLLYGLSFAVIVLFSIVTLVMDLYNFQDKSLETTPRSEVVFPSYDPNSVLWIPHEIYHYSNIVFFILVWCSTAALLHHYSRRFGKVKFWVIVSVPLVYFLSTTIDFFNLYSPESDSEQFNYYLYITLNSTAGGILYGLAFRTIGNTIRNSKLMRDYMSITAYGFVLLFLSSQGTLIDASYPPFGFVTVSFTGFSSYLILIGLYSSAISISQDTQLRQSVRKSAVEQTELLDSIGTARMEEEIEKKVMMLTRETQDNMAEQTGIQSSLTEEDLKQYLKGVLIEIKADRQQRT